MLRRKIAIKREAAWDEWNAARQAHRQSLFDTPADHRPTLSREDELQRLNRIADRAYAKFRRVDRLLDALTLNGRI